MGHCLMATEIPVDQLGSNENKMTNKDGDLICTVCDGRTGGKKDRWKQMRVYKLPTSLAFLNVCLAINHCLSSYNVVQQ